MLYFYQSISPHKIESLHNYLDHFFTQLFAGVSPSYVHAHHIHNDFQEIVDEYTTQIGNKLEAIFKAYMGLTGPEKQTVQDAYQANTDIENICNATIKPFKYNELPTGIQSSIKALYKNNLWEVILKYNKVREKCGTVKEHFNKFRQTNLNSVCPFCGLEGLDCEYDDGRDDYDHYFLKSKYPFISVHFQNLFPMCHKCNSKSKGQKDAPYVPNSNPLTQRPIYFPYDGNTNRHDILVKITSTNTDLSDQTKWTLDVDCLPAINRPKKDAWLEIFNIESRYKSRITKDNKHYRREIYERYMKKSKRTGFDFDDFKEDEVDLFRSITMQKEAIIWKVYSKSLLNDPNFENIANGAI